MKTKKISRRQFISDSAKSALILSIGSHTIMNVSSKTEYDILIKNGTVFDGLGNTGKELDLAIKGDKIFTIGKNLKEVKAKEIIDAKGLSVSPGFIDAHTHTDTNLLVEPKGQSQIRQGVTTEVSGNCGDSPVPISDENFETEKKNYKENYDIDIDWKEINGYFKAFEKRKTALNFSTLIGQGALRGAVVGLNDREPSKDEMEKMKRIVEDYMKAGALGLSTGLEYTPGSFAKTDELIELCKIVAKYNGVYATHMRNEDDTLIEAIQEAIKISMVSKASLQISHLKTCYPRNWSKIDKVIFEIERAKKEGVNILADRYPYTAFSTGLSVCFPLWVREGKTSDFISRLKDPGLDEKLKNILKEKEIKYGSWDKVTISSVHSEKNKSYQGKNVLELSKDLNKSPFEFIRDILIEEDGRVQMIVFAMSEDNLKLLLAHPLVTIGSDGASISPDGVLGKGKPHPRHYGTFARVLGKYVREEKILTLEKAIQKITSITARKFGFSKRGELKIGYFADITIFDPDKIIDKATWTNPHQYATGIETVIVNGKIAIRGGEQTGEMAGRVLRRGVA